MSAPVTRCVPNPAVEDVVKDLMTVASIDKPYRSPRDGRVIREAVPHSP
jgi:hypothetical protein